MYFKAKVLGLFSPGTLYKIDSQLTQISQEGLTNCSVPYSIKHSNIKTSCSELIKMLFSSTMLSSDADFKVFTSIIFHGPSGSGKTTIIEKCAQETGMHVQVVNCFLLIEDSLAATILRLNLEVEKAISCWPCVLILKYFHAMVQAWGDDIKDQLLNCISTLSSSAKIALVCTTDDIDSINATIQRIFGHICLICRSHYQKWGI